MKPAAKMESKGKGKRVRKFLPSKKGTKTSEELEQPGTSGENPPEDDELPREDPTSRLQELATEEKPSAFPFIKVIQALLHKIDELYGLDTIKILGKHIKQDASIAKRKKRKTVRSSKTGSLKPEAEHCEGDQSLQELFLELVMAGYDGHRDIGMNQSQAVQETSLMIGVRKVIVRDYVHRGLKKREAAGKGEPSEGDVPQTKSDDEATLAIDEKDEEEREEAGPDVSEEEDEDSDEDVEEEEVYEEAVSMQN